MAQQKPTIRNDLPPILRYGLAVGSVALALGLALFLERYNFRGVEFPLFLFAIAVSVWYAGLWPGVLAVVLSSLAFNYFFTEPLYTLYVSRIDLR
jgi:K+-sensing histidine kinase KdpD